MANETLPIKEENSKPHHTSGFKGYSLEDLRYQRALVALQKDFSKAKVVAHVEKLKNRNIFGSDSSSSKVARVGGIASKLLSGLSYLDYAMLGMSLFGSGKKIYKFFHNKRK